MAAAEPALTVLVNKAAIGGGADVGRRETGRQGHELRLTVNHLAPLLAASTPARVNNVASEGQAPVDLADIDVEHDYDNASGHVDGHRDDPAERLHRRGHGGRRAAPELRPAADPALAGRYVDRFADAPAHPQA